MLSSDTASINAGATTAPPDELDSAVPDSDPTSPADIGPRPVSGTNDDDDKDPSPTEVAEFTEPVPTPSHLVGYQTWTPVGDDHRSPAFSTEGPSYVETEPTFCLLYTSPSPRDS